MLATAIIRALKHPAFTAASFVPTDWDSAEDKAWFAAHVVHFLLKDCTETLFTKRFYNRLHCCFGFCADYG